MPDDLTIPRTSDLLWPVLRAVNALGGSAMRDEIVDHVRGTVKFTDEQLAVRNRNGRPKVLSQTMRTIQKLKEIGALESNQRGVYAMTQAGAGYLERGDARAVAEIRAIYEGKRFDAFRATTAREYLINEYSRMVYHVLLRDSSVSHRPGYCAAIAMKLRGQLLAGESTVRHIDVRDERRKLNSGCTYCGRPAETVDHLIPRLRQGPDSADNLVPACRWCNSSKGGRDVFVWAMSKGFFPLPVIRRYLVLAWRWTERAGLLDVPLETLRTADPPYRIGDIPWSVAAPATLESHGVSAPVVDGR